MSTIRITANDKQLALLVAFCAENKIACEIDTLPKSHVNTEFQTPSSALKHFCGTERMNSRGKMQPSEALNFIIDYSRRNHLIGPVALRLDESLQEVFLTKETSLLFSELSERVNAMFHD